MSCFIYFFFSSFLFLNLTNLFVEHPLPTFYSEKKDNKKVSFIERIRGSELPTKPNKQSSQKSHCEHLLLCLSFGDEIVRISYTQSYCKCSKKSQKTLWISQKKRLFLFVFAISTKKHVRTRPFRVQNYNIFFKYQEKSYDFLFLCTFYDNWFL